jgi:DnaJ-class molecular chaperone
MLTCRTCEGYGTIDCPKCKGEGQRFLDLTLGLMSFYCANCNGTGEISCKICHGTGEILKTAKRN